MKKRKVWRYTCDHCGKSNCSGGAMKQHEARCFKNPARSCPVCGAQWPVAELAGPMAALAGITTENEPALILDLQRSVDGCPACTLAAIIQGPLPMVSVPAYGLGGDDDATYEYRYSVKWDYKVARDEYRNEQMDSPGFQHCP